VIQDAHKDELELVRSGDSAVLRELYRKHRSAFIQWAKKKYTGVVGREADADVADVYQQTFTIFYFNVRDGKFTGMTSSIRTYIFAIGKNLLNKLAEQKRTAEPIDDVKESDLPADTIFERYEATHRQQLVGALLDNLGEPCKTILTKYYYEDFSMESIAERMGYKTAGVAKKKKCECLTKIRAALLAKQVQLDRSK
jgi:RNA polymerase sigma-70 factor (ECF subfamily)